MSTVIRKATLRDCAAIATIYNPYLGIATMDLEEKSAAYYRDILQHQDDMEELWVAEDGPITCWGIIKRYSDRKGYQFTGETSVYCHQEHLFKGYGTMMKKHLMNRCRQLGYHHLIARIFSTNEISIRYNLNLGYTIVGRQKEIGFINGQWQDVTVMQCLL